MRQMQRMQRRSLLAFREFILGGDLSKEPAEEYSMSKLTSFLYDGEYIDQKMDRRSQLRKQESNSETTRPTFELVSDMCFMCCVRSNAKPQEVSDCL